MEESCEVHSDDNKAIPEKNKKRRLKTPSQVEALEKFYSEHKYPSEEMKSQLAESVGLTEKQVSGWFCHRRLKDKKLFHVEASANGRQDRSSGIVQDRASGLRQDSCGSTKQGDNRLFDPREVESRRPSGQDVSAADLTYEHGCNHTENYSEMDDTSSDRSLPLQNMFNPQNEAPLEMAGSRYLPQNKNIAPINSMGMKPRIGPSGYLKIKGRVENSAITAVKRQLGRYYREDGPPLGVEFDPLPPGAFESSIREPDNETYDLGDPNLVHSSDVNRICNQPNFGMRYEVHNSKMSLHDSNLDGTNFKIGHEPDQPENCFSHQSRPKPLLSNQGNHFPGQNSLLEMDDNYAGEMSVFDGSRPYKMRAKHVVEGKRMDSVPRHHLHPYSQKVTVGKTDPWLSNSDDASPVDAQLEVFERTHSNVTLKRGKSCGMEDKRISRRICKEDKMIGERRETNEYGNLSKMMVHSTNEIRVAERDRNEFPQQNHAKKLSSEDMPLWTSQVKRSAAEMPSSFSEDETVETSSSLD